MSRRAAREKAVQCLYEIAVGGTSPEESLSAMLSRVEQEDGEEQGPKSFDPDFVKTLVMGTMQHLPQLDERISRHLKKGWRLERLSAVDLSILRLSAYEMLELGTPLGAAIHEAVELAQTFSTEEAARFINGLLSALAREQMGNGEGQG